MTNKAETASESPPETQAGLKYDTGVKRIHKSEKQRR